MRESTLCCVLLNRKKKNAVDKCRWRISVINAPGELIFQHYCLRGSSSGGELFFQCNLFTSDKMNLVQTVAKLNFFGQITVPKVYAMSSPGIIRGREFVFRCRCREAEFIKRGILSRKYGIFSPPEQLYWLPADLSAIQNIGSCETIWNLGFDNPAGNIQNSKCCLQAQLFSVFSWHADVTGMHTACVTRGY